MAISLLTTEPQNRRIGDLQEQCAAFARTVATLRNRDALKTQFLANISHDLRTPLSAIVTNAEVLREGILGPLDERQRESLAAIIGAGRQLLGMVDEILTYARGSANRLTVQRSPFAVDALVHEVCEMSAPLIAKQRHDLAVDTAPGLPVVHADREKVGHVLGNLLGNAIEFTPPGGRVWVKARHGAASPAGPTVEIEVGDTGIGIAPEHHEFVFREFAQVDATPARRHHGTGLGLAIARKFVEIQGGRIWVDSRVGQGSRFFFTIPVR